MREYIPLFVAAIFIAAIFVISTSCNTECNTEQNKKQSIAGEILQGEHILNSIKIEKDMVIFSWNTDTSKIYSKLPIDKFREINGNIDKPYIKFRWVRGNSSLDKNIKYIMENRIVYMEVHCKENLFSLKKSYNKYNEIEYDN